MTQSSLIFNFELLHNYEDDLQNLVLRISF